MSFHAVYVRMPEAELQTLVASPSALATFDVEARIEDGSGLDLGRGWDELGCLLEGGISTPRSGPTVGERAIGEEALAAWSYVTTERVKKFATELGEVTRDDFLGLYEVGDEGTADRPLEEHTGLWEDRVEDLYGKLSRLSAHYAAAAVNGEGMLVRIAKRGG